MYILQQFYFSNTLSHCKYYHNYFQALFELKNTVSCADMKPTEKNDNKTKTPYKHNVPETDDFCIFILFVFVTQMYKCKFEFKSKLLRNYKDEWKLKTMSLPKLRT